MMSKRFQLLMMFIIAFCSAKAQAVSETSGTLILNGEITCDNLLIKGVTIYKIKGAFSGSPVFADSIKCHDENFRVTLTLGEDYLLKFVKPGYKTSTCWVYSKISDENRKKLIRNTVKLTIPLSKLDLSIINPLKSKKEENAGSVSVKYFKNNNCFEVFNSMEIYNEFGGETLDSIILNSALIVEGKKTSGKYLFVKKPVLNMVTPKDSGDWYYLSLVKPFSVLKGKSDSSKMYQFVFSAKPPPKGWADKNSGDHYGIYFFKENVAFRDTIKKYDSARFVERLKEVDFTENLPRERLVKFLKNYYNLSLVPIMGQTDHSPDLYNVINSRACSGLTDTIKKSWVLDKKFDFYHSKFTKDFNKDTTIDITLPCMTKVKKTDTQDLFGIANRIARHYKYFTAKPYKDCLADSYLTVICFGDKIGKITETFCPGVIDYFKDNWKFSTETKLYESPWIPSLLGAKGITKRSLTDLKENEVVKLFGNPSSKTKKGSETTLHYLSSTAGKYEYAGVKIDFHSEKNSITAYNCLHSIDSVKAHWSYDEKKHFYKTKYGRGNFDLLAICFDGMDSTTIIQTFGKPSSFIKGQWEYDIAGPQKDTAYDTQAILISVNEKAELTNITYHWPTKKYYPSHKTPNYKLKKSNITCKGLNNGTLAVRTFTGGPPYTYTWLPGGQTTKEITGLSPGNYSVTMTDSKGFVSTGNDSITEPEGILNVISATASECSQASGTASITTSGGKGKYRYLWNTGDTTSNVSGLMYGTYHIIVMDSNGCTKTNKVEVKSHWDCFLKRNETSNNYNNFLPVNSKYAKPEYWPFTKGKTKVAIENLFGKPNLITNAKSGYQLKYYTSKPFKNILAESFVTVSFENEKVSKISEINCSGTIDSLKTNWHYIPETKLYSAKIYPTSFGNKPILNKSLNELNMENVIKIFGTPTYQVLVRFRSRVYTHNSAEVLANEIKIPAKPTDSTTVSFRYITSRKSRFEDSGVEFKFNQKDETNSISAFNCEHSLDSLKTIWNLGKKAGGRNNTINCELFAQCLLGMDSLSIINLFGKPNLRVNNHWIYHVSTIDRHSETTKTYVIIVDKEQNLGAFYYEGTEIGGFD